MRDIFVIYALYMRIAKLLHGRNGFSVSTPSGPASDGVRETMTTLVRRAH